MVAFHQDILSSLIRVIFHQASQGVFYQGGLIKMASHHSGLLSGYQGGLSSGYEGSLSSWYQGGFSTGVPLVMLNYENQGGRGGELARKWKSWRLVQCYRGSMVLLQVTRSSTRRSSARCAPTCSPCTRTSGTLSSTLASTRCDAPSSGSCSPPGCSVQRGQSHLEMTGRGTGLPKKKGKKRVALGLQWVVHGSRMLTV